MKFKVGDKVRIKKDLDSNKMYRVLIVSEMEEYKGKVAEIVAVRGKTGYALDIDKGYWKWSDDTFELVESKKFTKSDLQDGDLITYRNGDKAIKLKGEIQDLISKEEGFLYLSDVTEELNVQAQKNGELDIIKVERPVKYETVYERVEEEKKEILDETEREYLKAVIKPFKKRVNFIRKTESNMLFEKELLLIQLNDDDLILPYFEKETMYKGMELGKKYTLEELEI